MCRQDHRAQDHGFIIYLLSFLRFFVVGVSVGPRFDMATTIMSEKSLVLKFEDEPGGSY